MPWFAMVYPPEDERMLFKEDALFIGPRHATRESAEDRLSAQLERVQQYRLPLVGYLLKLDDNGRLLELHRTTVPAQPRADNPSGAPMSQRDHGKFIRDLGENGEKKDFLSVLKGLNPRAHAKVKNKGITHVLIAVRDEVFPNGSLRKFPQAMRADAKKGYDAITDRIKGAVPGRKPNPAGGGEGGAHYTTRVRRMAHVVGLEDRLSGSADQKKAQAARVRDALKGVRSRDGRLRALVETLGGDYASIPRSDRDAMGFELAAIEWGKKDPHRIANPAKGSAKNVTPDLRLKLAPRDTEWDADAAVKRVRAHLKTGKKASKKYAKYFMWHDHQRWWDLTAYKLPFVDVVNGRLVIVPRAISAIKTVLHGGRSGLDIPEADKKRVAAAVAKLEPRIEKLPKGGRGRRGNPAAAGSISADPADDPECGPSQPESREPNPTAHKFRSRIPTQPMLVKGVDHLPKRLHYATDVSFEDGLGAELETYKVAAQAEIDKRKSKRQLDADAKLEDNRARWRTYYDAMVRLAADAAKLGYVAADGIDVTLSLRPGCEDESGRGDRWVDGEIYMALHGPWPLERELDSKVWVAIQWDPPRKSKCGWQVMLQSRSGGEVFKKLATSPSDLKAHMRRALEALKSMNKTYGVAEDPALQALTGDMDPSALGATVRSRVPESVPTTAIIAGLITHGRLGRKDVLGVAPKAERKEPTEEEKREREKKKVERALKTVEGVVELSPESKKEVERALEKKAGGEDVEPIDLSGASNAWERGLKLTKAKAPGVLAAATAGDGEARVALLAKAAELVPDSKVADAPEIVEKWEQGAVKSKLQSEYGCLTAEECGPEIPAKELREAVAGAVQSAPPGGLTLGEVLDAAAKTLGQRPGAEPVLRQLTALVRLGKVAGHDSKGETRAALPGKGTRYSTPRKARALKEAYSGKAAPKKAPEGPVLVPKTKAEWKAALKRTKDGGGNQAFRELVRKKAAEIVRLKGWDNPTARDPAGPYKRSDRVSYYGGADARLVVHAWAQGETPEDGRKTVEAARKRRVQAHIVREKKGGTSHVTALDVGDSLDLSETQAKEYLERLGLTESAKGQFALKKEAAPAKKASAGELKWTGPKRGDPTGRRTAKEDGVTYVITKGVRGWNVEYMIAGEMVDSARGDTVGQAKAEAELYRKGRAKRKPAKGEPKETGWAKVKAAPAVALKAIERELKAAEKAKPREADAKRARDMALFAGRRVVGQDNVRARVSDAVAQGVKLSKHYEEARGSRVGPGWAQNLSDAYTGLIVQFAAYVEAEARLRGEELARGFLLKGLKAKKVDGVQEVVTTYETDQERLNELVSYLPTTAAAAEQHKTYRMPTKLDLGNGGMLRVDLTMERAPGNRGVVLIFKPGKKTFYAAIRGRGEEVVVRVAGTKAKALEGRKAEKKAAAKKAAPKKTAPKKKAVKPEVLREGEVSDGQVNAALVVLSEQDGFVGAVGVDVTTDVALELERRGLAEIDESVRGDQPPIQLTSKGVGALKKPAKGSGEPMSDAELEERVAKAMMGGENVSDLADQIAALLG